MASTIVYERASPVRGGPLMGEVEIEQRRVHQLALENIRLTRDLNQCLADRNRERGRIAQLEREIRAVESNFARADQYWRAELDQRERIENELRRHHDADTDQRARFDADRRQSAAAIAGLERQLAACEQNLAQIKADGTHMLYTKDELEREWERATQRLAQAEARAQACADKQIDLEKRLERAETCCRERDTSMELVKKCEADLEAARKQASELSDRLAHGDQSLTERHVIAETLAKRMQTAEDSLRATLMDLSECRERADASQRDLERMRADLEAERESRAAEQASRTAELSSRELALTGEVNRLGAEIEELQRQLNEERAKKRPTVIRDTAPFQKRVNELERTLQDSERELRACVELRNRNARDLEACQLAKGVCEQRESIPDDERRSVAGQ